MCLLCAWCQLDASGLWTEGEVTSPASVVCAHCVPSPGPGILHMKIALIPQQPCKVF